MKFSDLVHAVKMEADRGYPQAAAAPTIRFGIGRHHAGNHPYAHVGHVRSCAPPFLTDDTRVRRAHVSLRQCQGGK